MAKSTARSSKLLLALARHNMVASSARVRQFDLTDGFYQFVDTEVRKSTPMPYSISSSSASIRRAWLENNDGLFVLVYDEGLCARRVEYKPRNNDGWRPENTVRVRLQSCAPHMDFQTGYVSAEPNSVQYRTVAGLDWSAGAPDDFAGADAVFIYRIAPKKK